MNNLKILIPLVLISACAHHRDVRPGEEVHYVAIKTDDKQAGARETLSQANHYCKETKQKAVIVSENAKYEGSGSEQDYVRNKNIAKTAQGVGGAVWALGGGGAASTAGGAVGLGGGVANGVLGKAFTVEMKFKCK